MRSVLSKFIMSSWADLSLKLRNVEEQERGDYWIDQIKNGARWTFAIEETTIFRKILIMQSPAQRDVMKLDSRYSGDRFIFPTRV